MIRRFFQLVIILTISILVGNVAYGMYKEFSLNTFPSNIIESTNVIEIKENKEDEAISLPKSYKGYIVDSKLEIPKIKLNTYVFEEYDEEAMWICPTKYYGPEPNGIGNYCIAAHNYNKQNMFDNIIKLESGDIIYLSDNENGKQQYTVYDVYKVDPDNTKPLLQNTNRKKEITLITCSDYSSKRIIVKAVET